MTAPESKWVAEAIRLVEEYLMADILFDDDHANDADLRAAKAKLRAHLQRQADLMERMGEALECLMNERSGAARLSNACIDAEAALIAFQESKQ
jgi:hypothetical protein